MEIKIMYHNPRLEKIRVSAVGDWIDLRAAERVELKAGGFHMISLGISMKLPEGYEAHIAPRSSSFRKWGFLQSLKRMTASVSSASWSACHPWNFSKSKHWMIGIGAASAAPA